MGGRVRGPPTDSMHATYRQSENYYHRNVTQGCDIVGETHVGELSSSRLHAGRRAVYCQI